MTQNAVAIVNDVLKAVSPAGTVGGHLLPCSSNQAFTTASVELLAARDPADVQDNVSGKRYFFIYYH